MTELVPWDYSDPKSVRRSTGRQRARIYDQSLVIRATVAARENGAAHRDQLRIDNGYKLAVQTVQNATRLNHLVTQVSRDNLGLEVTLRDIEKTVAFGAQTVIHGYMTRS